MNLMFVFRNLSLFLLVHVVRGSAAEENFDKSLVVPCTHVPNAYSPRGYFSYFRYIAGGRRYTEPGKFREYCGLPSHIPQDRSSSIKCNYDSRFHSQSGQDELIVNLLKSKRNGYFIDLAANDFCDLSNSYALEKHYDWKGLCVEASAEYLYSLAYNRSCTTVHNVVSQKDNEKLNFVNRGVYGSIVATEMDNTPATMREIKAKPVVETAVTLTTILKAFKAPRVIDYMSLDVEGAERVVLVGMDLSQYTISILTVERPTSAVHHILSNHGYWWVKLISTFGEALYIHESFEGLKEQMREAGAATRVVKDTEWKVKQTASHPYLLLPVWNEEKWMQSKAASASN